MHPGVSHDMDTCSTAKELLQGLMDKGQIEIYSARKEEGDACM